jgi:hypothetical protein
VARFLGWAAEEGFEVTPLSQEVPDDYRVPDVQVVRLRLLGPGPAGSEGSAQDPTGHEGPAPGPPGPEGPAQDSPGREGVATQQAATAAAADG